MQEGRSMSRTPARCRVGHGKARCIMFPGLMLLALAASAAISARAAAQGPPEITNPALLEARPPATRLQTLLSLPPKPPGPPSEIRDIVYDLNVLYTNFQLWNPTGNRSDKVRLRSYQGTGVNPNAPFVGPLIEVYPGQTVRMTLHNTLPDDPTCPIEG